ncbi:MAG TPA: peptidoglycan DD-metalloendopeptidase family protein [Allosphingosinicella sp.]|nr:peptidoglycan DD-metalloendopeptidase family protein [Allosphingosinicella sp.]
MRRLILSAALAASLAGVAAVRANAPTLEQAQREAADAARRSSRLEQQAAQAANEAQRARAQAEMLIADIQRIEAEISAAEARILLIDRARAVQRARLAEKQQPVTRLAAALQTMARRPPALALVQPGSVDDLVRVRAVLASTLPLVRERSAGLRAEAAAADRLLREAREAAAALAANRDSLKQRRLALARLEERELRRSEQLAGTALSESDRSLALGEEVRELAELMGSRSWQDRASRELAALMGPVLRPGSAPAAHSRASYRLPVEGRLLAGTGEISDAGVHARGLDFATSADAPVVAPRAGRIVYAGRFRSYGEVVIIDHGGGWTSAITHLAALRVRQGDSVRVGDPIGRASGRLGVELRHAGRPVPITSFIG